ncbi:MAG: septum formation initiator family protein [Methylacidiphilales bacterium]|nr:septum formation initiator family protein [Candidatus Methylacidiphilales bacterium]
MANARFLDPSSIPLKRQSGGNIWATLVPVIQGAIVIGLLAVVGLFFVPVIQTENNYKAEIAKKQREMAAALDEQAELKLETEHMKNDPAYVEHIARDQLNMGKPGETIIRFDRYQPVARPNTQSAQDQPADDSN